MTQVETKQAWRPSRLERQVSEIAHYDAEREAARIRKRKPSAGSTDWSNGLRTTSSQKRRSKAGLTCFAIKRASMLGMPASLITGTTGKRNGKNSRLHDILHSRNGAAPPAATPLIWLSQTDT